MLTQRTRRRALRALSAASLLACLWTSSATASPVLLAGAGSEKVNSTEIVLVQKGEKSVVTILPDYQGPLSSFAVIVPIPKDVALDRVTTLKREFIDRVATVSAPKFAEFWEMDPCSDEKFEQDWQRDMTAKDDTGFLGTMKTDPKTKVAKEMLLDVKAKTKDGEYKETVVGSAAVIKKWLAGKDYKLPSGADASFKEYEAAGYQFMALDVDTNRMELVGGDRAILSPIRYWTGSKVTKIPTRFGLPSAGKMQELQIFSLVPEQRMQVTNYPTKAAPTNLRVVNEYVASEDKKFNLKEKIGEFYAALHDAFAKKNKNTVLAEYAWPSDDCGKPCSTEPLLPHELLSLGGDVFEADLPEDVRRPKPPEMTDEEKMKLEALLAGKEGAAAKKEAEEQFEADREELVARKGILARNKYILSRLHYRYTAAGMPKDMELGAGAAITGGVDLPKGENAAADTSVKPSDKNQFQSRYNGVYDNKVVVKCDDPKHHRFGKAPRSYRGLRKIWVAEDLARRNRGRIDLEKAVLTPVPDLGLSGVKKPEEKPAAMAAEAEKKDEGGCSVHQGALPNGTPWALFAGLVGLTAWARRRRES